MNSASLRQRGDIPELQSVHTCIEEWRRSRPRRGPMPAALWTEAVQLARTHGVHAVAHALRLAYYALKKRVVAVAGPKPQTPGPSFVEVAVKNSPEICDTFVEMERSDGARLRVRVLSQEAVIALAHAFLKGQG